MKQLIKKISKNKYFQIILAYVVNFIIKFIYKTSKVVVKGDVDEILKYTSQGKSIILFTWHGRIAMAPMELNRLFKKEIKKGKRIVVLSSIHRDGQIASTIASTFNFEVIYGSSINHKKGDQKNTRSLSLIRSIMRLSTQNKVFVFTGDGPRGPAFQFNSKITNIVQKINIPIVCASISYSKKIQLKTWDYFQIPLPFGKITINYGKLHTIQKNESVEKINALLQEELDDLIKNND